MSDEYTGAYQQKYRYDERPCPLSDACRDCRCDANIFGDEAIHPSHRQPADPPSQPPVATERTEEPVAAPGARVQIVVSTPAAPDDSADFARRLATEYIRRGGLGGPAAGSIRA